MGILDSVVNALNTSGGAPAAGTSSSAVTSAILSMLRQPGGAVNGLGSLMQAFESGGLGHLFQSWVGSGQNLPVSAEQIQQALGNSGMLERIAQMAGGMPPSEVAQHLSTLLPQIVDHLTPNGQLHPGDAASALEGLAQRFL